VATLADTEEASLVARNGVESVQAWEQLQFGPLGHEDALTPPKVDVKALASDFYCAPVHVVTENALRRRDQRQRSMRLS
jgi:hypothetical protein